jgi:hypothetical protein
MYNCFESTFVRDDNKSTDVILWKVKWNGTLSIWICQYFFAQSI